MLEKTNNPRPVQRTIECAARVVVDLMYLGTPSATHRSRCGLEGMAMHTKHPGQRFACSDSRTCSSVSLTAAPLIFEQSVRQVTGQHDDYRLAGALRRGVENTLWNIRSTRNEKPLLPNCCCSARPPLTLMKEWYSLPRYHFDTVSEY